RAVVLSPDKPWLRMNHAQALMELKKWKEAIDELNAAIKIDPKEHDYWAWLGSCYASLKDRPNAIAAYSQAQKLKPDCPDCAFELGMSLSWTDRIDDAMAQLRKAIKLNPEEGLAYDTLGSMYLDRHQLDLAEE